MLGWGTMATMTAQLPLMLMPAGAVQIGEIAALVEDETGGRVFIRGELVFAWNAGDELGRRLAAVQLVAIKGARAVRVAEGVGVSEATVRRALPAAKPEPEQDETTSTDINDDDTCGDDADADQGRLRRPD